MAMVSGQSRWVKELRVIRISALTFALLAGFAPGIGHAQTNIDQASRHHRFLQPLASTATRPRADSLPAKTVGP
jgi:hypothetical protein